MKQIILGIITTFILLSYSFASDNSIVDPFQLKNLTQSRDEVLAIDEIHSPNGQLWAFEN